MNKWRTLLDFLRSKEEGSLVRRPELLALVDHKTTPRSGDMIDCYRLTLTKLGYLSRVAEGTYRILKHPPEQLGLKRSRNIVRGTSLEKKNIVLVYCDCPVGKCLGRDPRRCASIHAPIGNRSVKT